MLEKVLNDEILGSDEVLNGPIIYEEEDEEIFEEEDFNNEEGNQDNRRFLRMPVCFFIEEKFDNLPKNVQSVLKKNHKKLFESGLLYQEQIYLTIELIHLDPVYNCGLSVIGGLFGVSKGTISTYKKRMKRVGQQQGRPKKLSQEQLTLLYDEIESLYQKNRPPDIDMLIDIIFNKFALSIKYNTLYKTIRRSKHIKTFEAPVMESTRAEVPIEIIEKHYLILNNVFERLNVPPCLVLKKILF